MGKRSRERATGKTFRERFAEARERLGVYRPARRMAKRMQKTGDYSEFEELVSELEDEDINEFLLELDSVMDKRPILSTDPLIQNEYRILIEERKRRDNSAD